MKQKQESFLTYAQEQLPRLLSLMDRNFFSDTAGCFDRNFWHFKTSDFPSAARQMGAHALALVFSNKKSRYYQDAYLKKLIEMSINYTEKIQKDDGSFDEWYFNERGWAGPTAYLVHSYCRIYFLCIDYLSCESKNQILRIITKGANSLLTGNEKNIISNHIAIAATALYESWEITKEPKFKKRSKELLQELFDNTDPEGWCNEYKAPDIGYQSATLSFLSYIHEFTNDKNLESFAVKSLDFISYFIMPNGEIANTASSRYTVTHFFRCYEYWKDYSEIASRISSILKKESPEPCVHQHEDHYFIYRFVELFEAANLSSKNLSESSAELPVEKNISLSKIFPNAQVMIKSDSNYYWVIGLSKGLSLYGWSKKSETSLIDQGIVIRDKKNKIYISNENDHLEMINTSENKISSSFSLKRHYSKYFTPLKLILFRFIFLLFANHQKVAEIFKDKIKSILIKPKNKTSISLTRSLIFQEDGSIKVINTLTSRKKLSGKYFCNGQFNYKFVPQSNYFRSTDLSNYQRIVGQLNETNKQIIEYDVACVDS